MDIAREYGGRDNENDVFSNDFAIPFVPRYWFKPCHGVGSDDPHEKVLIRHPLADFD
jgi:hypothetical protein